MEPVTQDSFDISEWLALSDYGEDTPANGVSGEDVLIEDGPSDNNQGQPEILPCLPRAPMCLEFPAMSALPPGITTPEILETLPQGLDFDTDFLSIGFPAGDEFLVPLLPPTNNDPENASETSPTSQGLVENPQPAMDLVVLNSKKRKHDHSSGAVALTATKGAQFPSGLCYDFQLSVAEPPPKMRKRTARERKDMKEISRLSPCIRCRLYRKKCSIGLPCQQCVDSAQSSTMLKFPCIRVDISSEIGDDLFNLEFEFGFGIGDPLVDRASFAVALRPTRYKHTRELIPWDLNGKGETRKLGWRYRICTIHVQKLLLYINTQVQGYSKSGSKSNLEASVFLRSCIHFLNFVLRPYVSHSCWNESHHMCGITENAFTKINAFILPYLMCFHSVMEGRGIEYFDEREFMDSELFEQRISSNMGIYDFKRF